MLVGLTSCDQSILDRLVQAGQMPHFGRLRAEGAWGKLIPAEPLVGRALWASIATGRSPAVHGIMAGKVPRSDGGGVQPVGQTAWRHPAFWQTLQAAGRQTITVNWPATEPATAWAGTHVDSRFARATGPDFDTWAVPRRSVAPDTLRAALRDLRVHPTDVEGAMLAPFVPKLNEIDQYRSLSLVNLAVALAEVSTVHAVTTALLAEQDWDVAAVHYHCLEAIQRLFLHDGIDLRFENTVDIAYMFTDAMLGRLMELAGEDTTIWVVSPNGVRPGMDGKAVGWRASGFIAARGRWIEAGRTLDPMRLVDIAPSLLARFGLVAETDGKRIPALAPGMSRRTVMTPRPAAPAPDQHVAALRALGYDDTPDPAMQATLTRAEAERLLARGEALLGAGQIAAAEAALLEARKYVSPDSPSGLRRLALCRLLRGDAPGCREIGETLRRLTPRDGWGSLILAAGHALDGNAPAAWPHMAAAKESGGSSPELMSRLGGVALMLKEDQTARTYFETALRMDPDLLDARKGLDMALELSRKYEASPPA